MCCGVLQALVTSKEWDNHVVYGVVCSSKDMVTPLDPNAKFDRKHYFANPHLYRSIFAETVGQYASVIVNGIYWDQKFPRGAVVVCFCVLCIESTNVPFVYLHLQC